MPSSIKIGTRGSTLAITQANQIKTAIEAQFSDTTCELIIIKTSGDIQADAPLSEIGGKGVFIKAIEDALVSGHIDCAMHSLKDVTSTLAPGTEIVSFLDPESTADCVVCPNHPDWKKLTDIPTGAVLATGSQRRKALLKQLRPDIRTKDIRGNVDSRIQKCKEGFADGVLLSEAGVIRLERASEINISLAPADFIPAPGQGVVCVQARSGDSAVVKTLQTISSEQQSIQSRLDLHLLQALSLNCNFPLGSRIERVDNRFSMTVFWANAQLENPELETVTGTEAELIPQIDALASRIRDSLLLES